MCFHYLTKVPICYYHVLEKLTDNLNKYCLTKYEEFRAEGNILNVRFNRYVLCRTAFVYLCSKKSYPAIVKIVA